MSPPFSVLDVDARRPGTFLVQRQADSPNGDTALQAVLKFPL
jgi:hypothetical protein